MIELYNSAAWVDISDYVTNVQKAPNSMRNRDWTVKAERLVISVAVTIRTLLADETFKFTDGMLIRVSQGATFIYGGYVEESGYNNDSMEFDVTLKTSLGNLQQKIVDYDTLHAVFATGTNWYDYTAADYFSRGAIVGVLWTLKKMFSVSGLTLTTTDVDTVTLVTHIGSSPFRDCTTTFRDLFFYENMIWCAGQPVCVDHSIIDSQNYDYNRDKINCLDLVSEIITSLKLKLTQTSITEYNLEYVEDSYSIADDDVFSQSSRDIKAAVTDYVNNLSYLWFFNDPASYGSLTITNDGSFTYGKGRLLDSIKNFTIYYSDAKLNTNHYTESYDILTCIPSVFGDLSIDFIVDDNGPNASINRYAMRAKELATAYTKTDILTNFQSSKKNVIDHYIDLEWSNSVITQEAY